MDPKDPKVLMKEAREFYNKRDFHTAVLRCKAVLKKEPDNYLALVLQGVSFQELGKSQQSLECYKKAIAIDPKQIKAWQGIIQHYEKQNVKSHPDLLDAYKRVAVHFEKNDQQKYIENYLKMAHALIADQELVQALKVLMRLERTVGINLEIANVIVSILGTSKSDTRAPDIDKLYTAALEVIVTETPKPKEDMYRKYFSQVYRAGDYDKLNVHCLGMKSLWNVYYSPMEWICRLYLEERLVIPMDNQANDQVDSMDVITDKLFKLHPSSTYGYFARGKYLCDVKNSVSESINWVKTGLESSYNLYAVELMITCKLKVGEFLGAYEDCQTAIRKSTDSAQLKFKLLSVKSQIEIDPEKAQNLLDVIKSENPTLDASEKVVELQAMIHVKKREFGALEKLLSSYDISVNDWRLQLYKLLPSAIDDVPKIVKSISDYVSEPNNQNNFDLILEAAELVYRLQEYNLAGDLFSKATKTTTGNNHPSPWKYLGHIYNMQDDTQTASKCYKKSYDILPTPDVGALLSDTYASLDDHKQNKDFLTKATKQFRKANSKWVWVRLGLLYLHNGDANEAVVALQSAIRTDHADCHIWESLADAYFSRGSYTAALNAYREAIRLGADPTYPKLKIGVVFQALGEYDDSVEALQDLLKETPNNSPVLVELAKGRLQIAIQSLEKYLDISAIKAVQEGLLHAVRAIKFSSEQSILPWQIIGELTNILGVLPKDTQIRVPSALINNKPDETKPNASDEPIVEVSLVNLLKAGTGALIKGLSLANAGLSNKEVSTSLVSTVYYSLARSYYYRATITEDDKTNVLKQAVNCAKKAVSLNSNSHVYWNILGIISHAAGNDKLAQHSFIKSLMSESNNAVAWTNLGVIYLKHNELMLAHKAFAKAQSVEPTLAACWTGQGLVAEVLQPKEAMDLFRHSSQLSLSPSSVIAYADWVCQTLTQKGDNRESDYDYSIVHLDAVNVAGDLIGKIVERHPSAYSYNVKGILSGWNRLKETALKAFDVALEYASKDPSVTEKDMDVIRSNRISVLVKLGRYADAKSALAKLKTLDRITLANAALTCDKTGDLNKASELYQQLYSMAETEDGRSNALIAVALVLNRTTGVEAAKTFLFQSAKNPHGLLALCSIGLMNNDLVLVEAVLQELKAFEYDKDFVADLGLMRSFAAIMKGQLRPALNALLKLIHMFPTIAKLRTNLSSVILMYHNQYFAPSVPRNFIIQAENVMKILSLSLPSSEIQENDSDPAFDTCALVALTYLLENNWSSASTTALKALKHYPSKKDNWAVLACALWFQYTETRSTAVYDRIIKITEKVQSLVLSDAVQQWMGLFTQKISALSASNT